MKQFLISLLCLLSFVASAEKSPYDAARKGDLDSLRQYRFEGIDLFVPDERGFTPYELSALHADPEQPDGLRKHVEVMLWLKEYQPEKHRYGSASIALVQSGLNALGYDVGKPDGIMGKNTAEAIRAYQNDNELATTGRLGPQWLGSFYQDILKDMQFKLTKLGFNTKGTDGMMGRNTRKAMLAYRQEQGVNTPEYPHLDAALLSHIDNTYVAGEKRKKAAIAKKARIAKENEIRFAQAGLRTLGHRIGKVDGMFGSKTANAIKKFQTKYKLSVSGEIDKKTQAQMDTIFLKETQRKLNFLGYNVGKPDGKMGNKTLKALKSYREKHELSGKGLTSAVIVSIDDRFDEALHEAAHAKQVRAAKKAAAKKKATKSKKTKKATAKKTTAKSKKQTAKKASKQATKKTTAKNKKAAVRTPLPGSKKSSSKTSSKATAKVVPKKSTKTTKKAVKTVAKTSKKKSSIRGNRAKGRMSFRRKGGRVVGCSIAGRGIPIEWCEPFYPLPKNNHCEATFKTASGVVLNLWCK